MFDRYTYSKNYNHTRVTEQRALTDESVRLLKEMEEKAREKIIDSFTVRDTNFECKIIQEKDMITGDMHFVIIYSMNGTRRTVRVRVEEHLHLDTPKMIFEAAANDIAYNMLSDAFTKAMK